METDQIATEVMLQSEQEKWTVRYPSEGALEADLFFNDGSAIRINAPLARIIADAHNATLQQ